VSCGTQEAPIVWREYSLLEVEQAWNLSKIEGEIYAIVFQDTGLSRTGENYAAANPDHKLPALLFFHDGQAGGLLSPRSRSSPRMYVAIWEDGLIVWGAGRDSKLIAEDIENHALEIKYFQSKVDPEKIKKLLVVLAKSSIWENPVPLVNANPPPPSTELIVRSEGKKYTYTASRIDASAMRRYGREFEGAAREWERITKEIFDLIPEEGRPVNISFTHRGSGEPPPFGWLGIVE